MTIDLNALRTQLPSGWQYTIAGETGIPSTTVWRTLHGKSKKKKSEVIKAAVKLLNKKKKEDQELAEQVDKALSKE